MLSHPKLYKTPPNPYLVKNDGKSAVFRVPLPETLVILFLGIVFGAAGMVLTVEAVMQLGLSFEGVMMVVFGLSVLSCGVFLLMNTGANSIAFDLHRRTYRRVLLIPELGWRALDSAGRGNPLFRRTIAGPMSDLKGIQIVERENNASRTYSVYVVSEDQQVFPCVVYASESLMAAQAQAHQISSLLGLTVLKALLINNFEPLPAPYGGTMPGNSYLARRDQRTVVFRTPLWRVILGLCLGGFLCGLPIAATVMSMERWGGPNLFLLIEGLPLIVFGIFIALSSGANEIALDLKDRSYRRVLLPLPAITGAKSRNLTGTGNPLGGRTINGEMSEIEGVQLVEGRGKNGRLYAVRLIWAENAYPPFSVYFSDGSLEDARAQQYEITMLLKLPILEPEQL